MDLISQVPIIEVAANHAMCDGGGGATGHPIEVRCGGAQGIVGAGARHGKDAGPRRAAREAPTGSRARDGARRLSLPQPIPPPHPPFPLPPLLLRAQYIKLDKKTGEGCNTCKYCGLRFQRKAGFHGH
jgi:uncharacterized Zn-finger protein